MENGRQVDFEIFPSFNYLRSNSHNAHQMYTHWQFTKYLICTCSISNTCTSGCTCRPSFWWMMSEMDTYNVHAHDCTCSHVDDMHVHVDRLYTTDKSDVHAPNTTSCASPYSTASANPAMYVPASTSSTLSTIKSYWFSSVVFTSTSPTNSG